MLDIIDIEEKEAFEGFTIDNDDKAEWALKKIKEAEEEHDRLMALIVKAQAELEGKEKDLDKKLENETAYLKHLLGQYLDTVKTKDTKTQKSYQLLSGKLVKKLGGIEYVRDEEKLLEWAKDNRPLLVKTTFKTDWAALKKEIFVAPDGTVCTEDGEIIECIKAEAKPDTFDIKW